MTTRKKKPCGALFHLSNKYKSHASQDSLGTSNRCVFILGHSRFYSKRQYPYIILSDNGKWTEEEVNNNQTNWLFNPPRSPWMSGAMESIVKTTKAALKQS